MLHLHSEPVAPTGSLTATGMRNVLGRPDIDFWSLFVRELVQNSCDARLGDATPVTFGIDVRSLTESEHRVLVDDVLGELPVDGDSERWRRIRGDRRVIIVSDSGTVGLGGPTRADEAADGPTDFADFVWNVGQPAGEGLGGGTYGYGKSVLYRASTAATIVIYTRCLREGGRGLESRLIACALCDPFEASSSRGTQRFTGRHWWGVPGTDPAVPVQPLIGTEADRIATALGITRDPGATGTTLMITAPAIDEFAEESDDDAGGTLARNLAGSIAWHCWPLMSGTPGVPRLMPRLTVHGQPVAVPDPRQHPELRHFCRALDAIKGDVQGVLDVGVLKPKQHTGRLALLLHVDDSLEEPGRPIRGSVHHVALMRHPHLVVTYLNGPRAPLPDLAWSGVFVADDDVDRVFAASEPPAHDAWVPQSIEDQASRRVVNVTLRRIAELVSNHLRPPDEIPAGSEVPLGGISEMLGDLLPRPVRQPVPPRPPGGGGAGPGGGSGGRQPDPVSPLRVGTASIVDRKLALLGEARVLSVRFRASARPNTPIRVTLVAGVATNEGAGREVVPPLGAPCPRVVRYISSSGIAVDEPSVVVRSGDEEWVGYVDIPEELALRVQLRVEPA